MGARAALVMLAVLVVGCWSSMNVETRFDPAADFGNLQTFAWDPESVGESKTRGATNPQSQRRIVAAVERELGARGFRKVDSDPDFLVGFATVVVDSVDTRTVYPDSVVGYVSRRQAVEMLTKGTLFLFIARPDGRTVIWQGSASETLDRPTREEIDAAIDLAVRSILAEFPPGR